ncbi:MAG TPA: phosphoribosyltransferase family protein [Candidatus Dormibacteraeota bacterium]|nr:phosphoribosyltransferase family protein [Candidatus Dormibacteraeota bacterium]
MRYLNRLDAGQRLGRALQRYKDGNTVVLALPRGGVVVGVEVARTLLAPLGLVLVRKIGHPHNPEYAIGAIAENEPPVYNEHERLSTSEHWRDQAEADTRNLIEKRRELYYGEDFRPPEVEGKIVIIVDDGIATGLTMEAAVRAIRQRHPAKLVVAIPVAPPDSVSVLEELADEVIVLDKPKNFQGAVGAHYQQFEQVNDEEVRELLREVQDDLL